MIGGFLFTLDDDKRYRTAESECNTQHQRREFPPVRIHSKLDEYAVLDLHYKGILKGCFLGDLCFLCGDGEITFGYDGFFDPYIAEGQTVEDDLTVDVYHHIHDSAVLVEEIAAVFHLSKGQSFKTQTVFHLDAETCACEGIACLCINLEDLETCGIVLDCHSIGLTVGVGIRQPERIFIFGDVTDGCVLNELVFTFGEIVELRIARG